jgi:hypothetical protein
MEERKGHKTREYKIWDGRLLKPTLLFIDYNILTVNYRVKLPCKAVFQIQPHNLIRQAILSCLFSTMLEVSFLRLQIEDFVMKRQPLEHRQS